VSQAPVQVASATVVLVWAEVALVLSTPFFFAGICVSLALTRSPFPVGAVYAADLSGAAAGCLGVFGLLGWLDAPSAILAVAAIAAVAAGLFSRSVADQRPGQPVTPRLYQSSFPLAAVLFLAAVFNAMTIHGLQPVLVKDKVDDRMQVEYEKWNTYSRIQVRYPWVDTPWLWSPSDTLPATYSVEQRSMNIDGDAGTVMFGFDGKPQDAAFLQYDVTNVAYRLRNTGKAAVIGVGGGRDVLSAWVSGFRDITAVELNPIFIELLTTREPFASFAGLAALPGIHFHVDEARSWFARTDERFDL